MKRDIDLIRAILLEVESWPPGARIPSTRLVVEPYTEEQIRYHADLLHEAGLIGGVVAVHRASGDRPTIVGRLTWSGHEFVDATRSDAVWVAVKERAKPVGNSMSMDLLAELVSSVSKSMMLPLASAERIGELSMNQNVSVTQAPNGPLTWIWYLCLLAVMTTLGSNMAVAMVGQGSFQAFIGALVGALAAVAIAWLWRQIRSLTTRLILGALFLVVAAISALVAQSLLESRDDVIEVLPAPMAEEGPWTQYQEPAPPITDPFEAASAPAPPPPQQFSDIDRINADLQRQREAVETAREAGRAAGKAYEDEQSRR